MKISDLLEKETKKDACYHKVKSRYDVWPSAYASAALSKCRKVGAKNWGNKSKKGKRKKTNEDLRKWFKQKWVNADTGKPCGKEDRKNAGKPKCLPKAKRDSMSDKERKATVAKKRREDPNANRKGKAKNVSTK